MKHTKPAPRASRRPAHHAADADTDDTPLTRSQRNSLALAFMMLATPGPLLAQAHAPTTSATASPGQPYTTVSNDTVWRLAGLASSKGSGDRAAVMVAILRRNPAAFVHGNLHRLKRGVSITLPSAEDIAAEDPLLAAMLVESHLRVLDQVGAGAPGLPPLRARTPEGRAPDPATASARTATPAPATAAPAPAPTPAVAAKPGPTTAPALAPAAPAAPVTPAKPLAQASAPAAPVAVQPPVAQKPTPAPTSTVASQRAPAPVASAAAPMPTQASAPSATSTASAALPSPASATQATSVATQPSAAVAARPALRAQNEGSELGALRVLPYAMLVALLALPVGWVGYRRFSRKHRSMRDRLVAASSDFGDSRPGRGHKPKRVEVSTAAVEVARVVETLKPVATLVRRAEGAGTASPSSGLAGNELREQIALKLEIARASIEVGRVLMARTLLSIVQQEGDEVERGAATELMMTLA
ncbi:MAG: hypothetical protein RIQ60_1293 [Pseudomonadota bacterium]|jgi:FimV-like protein